MQFIYISSLTFSQVTVVILIPLSLCLNFYLVLAFVHLLNLLLSLICHSRLHNILLQIYKLEIYEIMRFITFYAFSFNSLAAIFLAVFVDIRMDLEVQPP